MKKTVSVEQIKCDFCGEEAWSGCLQCGKDICYECRKTHAKEYSHGVNVGGSGDGTYCNDCDDKLRKTNDPLHAAYRKIEALKNEANGFYANFKVRQDEAEKALKELQEKTAT